MSYGESRRRYPNCDRASEMGNGSGPIFRVFLAIGGVKGIRKDALHVRSSNMYVQHVYWNGGSCKPPCQLHG